MNTVEERLARIEARLARIEALFKLETPAATKSVMPEPVSTGQAASAPVSGSSAQASPARTEPSAAEPPARPPRFRDPQWDVPAGSAGPRRHAPVGESLSVTRILGWSGATALVLAAVYLIRLAFDAGWLTPARQVGLAALGGVGLIGAGLALRRRDRDYASLLPAGGLVVLFLATYGAHLVYQLLAAPAATVAVIAICLAALWLGRLFASELYGLFAVVGSYSAPFLLPALAATTTDLAIYYSAWSGLFCVYAVWLGSRRPYLLAAYLALLGFSGLTQAAGRADWLAVFAFQSVQFAIFLGGAVGYSVRRQSPLGQAEALAHLPLLLIFYALQYALLDRHVPALAPWLALASAAVLLAVYALVRRWLAARPEAGALLVGAYVALALFHAGYLQLLPAEFAPWAALLIAPLLALAGRGQADEVAGLLRPLGWVLAVIFALNYADALFGQHAAGASDQPLLALLYAVELYAAVALAGRFPLLAGLRTPALYLGHAAMMSAAVQAFDARLAVSLVWGGTALACLLLAFHLRDKSLGQSSLLILAASAVKVFLFDLADAGPLARVGLLGVLGVTLYAGGWLYQRVNQLDADPDSLTPPAG